MSNAKESEFEKRLSALEEYSRKNFNKIGMCLDKIESLEEKMKSFAPAIESILNLTNIERKLIRGQLEASEK